ncbi:hypothetical protein EW146_g999 [Bondarzewia mesenterica]|uniref:NAD(P)-binding domain-containing protein n=1 Tax=Bondarzewia mesenterica TaxID=1095465 RepID=A0A4S4M6Q8_9AGAM|nr:hypothetical protein EW146_g999 [Bondarzewia mesenterica]
MKVLLTGATGAAGLATLRVLLGNPSVSHVTTITRRPLPAWVKLPDSPPATAPDASPTHPKLTSLTLSSFLSYPKELFPTIAEHDACIWALGTSSQGVTESQYIEITEGYLKVFMDALKDCGAGSVEKPFRVVFGRAENALFGFARDSSGSIKATVIRPAYFHPSPAYPLDAQNQRNLGMRWLDKILTPSFSVLAPSMIMRIEDLGKFAVEAAKGKWEDKGQLFENPDMKRLMKEAGEPFALNIYHRTYFPLCSRTNVTFISTLFIPSPTSVRSNASHSSPPNDERWTPWRGYDAGHLHSLDAQVLDMAGFGFQSATGAAGLAILRILLKDPSVSRITTLTRRPLPSWVVLPGSHSTSPELPNAAPTHPKLTSLILSTFLSYSNGLLPVLAEHDACIWALGTSSRGKSKKTYIEITEGYLSAFLEALEKAAVGDAEKPFRFVFGRAERALLDFAHGSSGHIKATIIRPARFFPSPEYPQDARHQRSSFQRFVNKVLGPVWSTVFPSLEIPIDVLGRFAVEAAKGSWDEKGEVFRNTEMKKLLKESTLEM